MSWLLIFAAVLAAWWLTCAVAHHAANRADRAQQGGDQ